MMDANDYSVCDRCLDGSGVCVGSRCKVFRDRCLELAAMRPVVELRVQVMNAKAGRGCKGSASDDGPSPAGATSFRCRRCGTVTVDSGPCPLCGAVVPPSPY